MFRIALFLLLGASPSGSFPHSEAQPTPASLWESEFRIALQQIEAFSNDSAQAILSCLIEELDEAEALSTPLGLQIRLRHAEVLEKNDEDERSIQALLDLIEESQAAKNWKIKAHAHILLGRMYEKHEQWDLCEAYLQRAARLIEARELDVLYARLCLRFSSLYRQTGRQDSALVHARRAIRAAASFGQTEYESTAYLLMGHLLREKAPQRALAHYEQGARGYKQIGNRQLQPLRLPALWDSPLSPVGKGLCESPAAQRFLALGDPNGR